MGNTPTTNRRNSSSVESSENEEDQGSFIETAKKKEEKVTNAYLTLILANKQRLYFTREEFWRPWNCTDKGSGKILSLEFLTVDNFNIIRKMWEEKPDYNENKSLFEEKDDEILILYIRACRIIDVNISGYLFALDTLLGRHKLSVIRETIKKMQIYETDLIRKFCDRVVSKFMKEIKYVDDKSQNKWIWASDYSTDDDLKIEEEYYDDYPAFELRASYSELDETQKLNALQMVKTWIHEYSIGVFKFSTILRGRGTQDINLDYSFSDWEIRELLSEDMPALEVLEIRNFNDETIQIIGERIPKLRISSLIFHINKYMEKGFEEFCTGIGLNEHLNAVVMHLSEMTTECAENILAKFTRGIIKNQTIKYIKLKSYGNKPIRNDFIQLFGRVSTLKSLILSYLNLQDSGPYFEKFLSENTSIRTLSLRKYMLELVILFIDIEYCELGDKEIISIAKGIKIGNSVKYLNLERNKIGDTGGKCLAQLLYEHQILKYIWLSGNVYGNQTIKHFSYYLSQIPEPIPEIWLEQPKEFNSYEYKIYQIIKNQKINNPQSFLKDKKVIKDYECLYILGTGAFGTTYLVRQGLEFYALKEIFGEEKDRSRFTEAFNEVEIMKILRHRNIIGFIDSFIENNSFYIVMPVAMNSVSQLLIKYLRSRDMNNCIKCGREVAEGLAIIHSNNLVHLDLKPDNIFLDEYNCPLIGDFGISNQAMRGEIQEYVTTDQGTMPYLAPEIWQGREFKLEPDIFAYGIILHELLTGKRPFTPSFFGGYSEVICVGKYDEGELENMKIDRDAKMQLMELIRGCLEVERKKRLKIWDILGQINMIYGNRVFPPIFPKVGWYSCGLCDYDLCASCIKQLPNMFCPEGAEQLNEEVPKCKNNHQMKLIYSYNIDNFDFGLMGKIICDGCKTVICDNSKMDLSFGFSRVNYTKKNIHDHEETSLKNIDGNQIKYYLNRENDWVLTVNDHSIAVNYDIFRRIIHFPAFVAQMDQESLEYKENMYCINIDKRQVGGIFYTDIFKQRNVLKPIDILKWLIEIIFPIKYLHDNNIYYHNLSVHNLLLDQNQRLSLAPSNFPFHLYFTKVDVFSKYSAGGWRYIRTKEFPQLSQDMIELEVRGVFEFWYELCTKKKFTGENNNFGLIENFYGSRWRSLIENSLTKELVVTTWHDLNRLIHEEWAVLMKQNISFIDQHPESQIENAEGDEINKIEEEFKMQKESKMPYNEDAEMEEVHFIPLSLPTLEEKTIPENEEKEDQVLRQNLKSECYTTQRSSQELIHEELGVVDQHPENVEGEKISKVEEELKMPKESKISYNEDAEVEAPLIPHTLPTLEEQTIPEEEEKKDQVLTQNLTNKQEKDRSSTRSAQNELCCCLLF